MGDLTITTFVTLDGVMQAPGGDGEDSSGGFKHGGWLPPYFDEVAGATMNEIFAKADAFLLGRTTYDIFASHWPHVTDENDPVATALNTLPKFVASRTRSSFEWHNTTHVADVVKSIKDIKQQFSGEIQVHGSWGLAQTLIQHSLIDEYRLLIFPVLVGNGKRLFGEGAVPAALSLIESKVTTKGVVISFYRAAGELQTGMVPLPE